MNLLRKLLPSNSLPKEQEAEVLGNIRNSLIARDSDVNEELEHAEIQPQKRQRIMDEQSIVIRDQEQGSSSSSQLKCHLDMLPSKSALSPKIESLKVKLDLLFARRSDVLTELKNAELQVGQKQREEVRHWLTEVQSLKEKLGRLFARRSILTKLKNIEFQVGQKQREEVRRWLTEVQRVKYKIQSMINDGQGSSSNSNLSDSIESFIKEVDELIQRSRFPNGLVLLDQESTRLPLLLDIKPVGINFKRNTEKILGWLRNHKQCIIGVYGMGGVGKTTLLTHIHDQLLKDSNLSQVIGRVYWVTVSQSCPVHKLQKDIAKALGLEDIKEDDERKRAAFLCNRLAAKGQTVLILDDMWEQVSLSKVGIPVENGNCKIILSTRSSDVCRKMGCKDLVIKAKTLNKGEAWDLFVEKLGHYDTLEEEAKKIAWDIAKKCCGLPLAIATMARSMTGIVDINEWSTALNDLESACDQADMKEDVFRILQYSYDRLNDKRVQNCFLSCLLYGNARTTLINHWINEGLLDDIKSRDAQVSKGHTILNKLERSCLLESVLYYDKEKCVKMHDLIKDMAIIVTKEDPLFIAEAGKRLEHVPEEEKWSKDLAKVSLSHNRIEEIPSGMAPVTPNLTVLMLNGNPLKEIPDSFFVHMKALTVLDLYETNIERVPESVSDLENLRVLMLAGCEELIYVPSVAKLTKLRILDLDRCYRLKEAPWGIERLKCVEKLSYIPWDVSDMIGFNKIIQYLPSLGLSKIRIRALTLCESFPVLKKVFSSYEKVAWITGGEFGEDKSSCLLPTTPECLIIEECDIKGCLGDVFRSLVEGTGVKYIDIKDCRGLESISGSSGTQQGFPISFRTRQFECLKLEGLPDLRSIAKPGVPHSFSRLRELCVSGCPKLKAVLPHLVTVEALSSSIIYLALPNLVYLVLRDLSTIEVIFPFTERLLLPSLRRIEVAECEKVEEIFESNKATQSNPIIYLPNLRDGLVLIKLPKLGCIYRGLLRCSSLVIPDRLQIEDCPKLKLWRTPEGRLTSDEACSTMEFPPETLHP